MVDTTTIHLHDAAKVVKYTDRAFQKLAVIGLGYIGLPTAAVFADAGLDVVGVDVNPAAVDSINAGQPHIVEPNLDRLLQDVVEKKNLRASLKAEEADAFRPFQSEPLKRWRRGWRKNALTFPFHKMLAKHLTFVSRIVLSGFCRVAS